MYVVLGVKDADSNTCCELRKERYMSQVTSRSHRGSQGSGGEGATLFAHPFYKSYVEGIKLL